ncbi:MAG TPA: hypothetical protein VNW06_02105 [Cytophagaceae bacterium]|jgi:hypothetical protein|nr:hypothetical protein [Cytophagaceae bacterium]
MPESRRNRRKKSRKGTVVSQLSRHARTHERLMDRNLEIMLDVVERIRTEDTEDMPYDICNVEIDCLRFGMKFNMSIIYKRVTKSEFVEFITSVFYNDEVNIMIEERIDNDVPKHVVQLRALLHRDFIGFILTEGFVDEDSNRHYPDIDFPIGPISMN